MGWPFGEGHIRPPPILLLTMSGFQAGVIEEFVNEALDDALDVEDLEEETEEEVDKVLTELASETAAQLPVAARKVKAKVPAQRTTVQVSREPGISIVLLSHF